MDSALQDRTAADENDVLAYVTLWEVPHVARGYIKRGTSTRAVRLLSCALLEFIENAPDSVAPENIERDQHNRGPIFWPKLGANLRFDGDSPPTIEYLKTEFTVAEATTYLDFYLGLLSLAKTQISKTKFSLPKWRIVLGRSIWLFRRKIAFAVPNLLNKWLARVPYRMPRRRKFRLIAFLKNAELKARKFGGDFVEPQLAEISGYLCEPVGKVRSHLRDCNAFQAFKYNEQVHYFSLSAEQKAQYFHWPDESAYADYFRGQNPSRIITSIHLGPVGSALYHVARHNRPGSMIMSLAQWESTAEEKHRYAKRCEDLGLNYLQIGGDQHDTIQTIAALRRGNTSLTIYYDLPTTFGETVEVVFFGRKAQFVRGPAELAVIGRVPIYPIFSFYDGSLPTIEIHEPINTSVRKGESIQAATARITQYLAGLAEHYIRRYPSQWQFLANLPGYFVARGAYLRR
jgi:hypothetical protein